jgi:hypothetical protein
MHLWDVCNSVIQVWNLCYTVNFIVFSGRTRARNRSGKQYTLAIRDDFVYSVSAQI